MKLNECIEIAKEYGLSTLGQAYDNVNFHANFLKNGGCYEIEKTSC